MAPPPAAPVSPVGVANASAKTSSRANKGVMTQKTRDVQAALTTSPQPAPAPPLPQQLPSRKRARSSAGPCWFRRAKKVCVAEQPSRAHEPEEHCTGTATNISAITALHAGDSAATNLVGQRHGVATEPGLTGRERALEGAGDAVPQMKQSCPRAPAHSDGPPDEAEVPTPAREGPESARRARAATKLRAPARRRAPTNPRRKRAASEKSSSRDHVSQALRTSSTAEEHDPALNAGIAAFLAGETPAPAPPTSGPIHTRAARSVRPRRQAAVAAAERASATVAQEAADEAAERREGGAKRRVKSVRKKTRVAEGAEVGGEIVKAKKKQGGRKGGRKIVGAQRVEELVEGVFRVGEGDAQKVVGVGKENQGLLERSGKHKEKAAGAGNESAHRKVKKPRARRALVDVDANL